MILGSDGIYNLTGLLEPWSIRREKESERRSEWQATRRRSRRHSSDALPVHTLQIVARHTLNFWNLIGLDFRGPLLSLSLSLCLPLSSQVPPSRSLRHSIDRLLLYIVCRHFYRSNHPRRRWMPLVLPLLSSLKPRQLGRVDSSLVPQAILEDKKAHTAVRAEDKSRFIHEE